MRLSFGENSVRKLFASARYSRHSECLVPVFMTINIKNVTVDLGKMMIQPARSPQLVPPDLFHGVTLFVYFLYCAFEERTFVTVRKKNYADT